MILYTTNKNLKGATLIKSVDEFWNLVQENYNKDKENKIVCFIPNDVFIESREVIRKALKEAKTILESSKAELIYLGADVSRHTKSISANITLANCFYTCGYVTTSKVVASFKRRFYGSKSTIDENICFHVKTAIFKKNIAHHRGHETQRKITFEQVYKKFIAHIS